MGVVDGGERVLHPRRAGQHSQQVADRAHLADGQHLLEEVLQRQFTGADLGGGVFGLLGIEDLLGLLDEAQHIAHAEDPAGHPVGVEDVEVVQLLAGGREQDRHAGDLADRQRRATAGVAVELGQHHAGEADTGPECLGGGHRVLADHRVEHEQRLVGGHRVADRGRLGHQHVVDAEPARGVDDDDVEHLSLGLSQPGRGHGHRVAGTCVAGFGRLGRGAGVRSEHGDPGPLADDLQLGDSPGALEIAGHQQWGMALPLEPARQLAGQGGLTRPLQAGQHDHRGRGLGERQLAGLPAEDADELVVDDFDDLLGRVQCARDLRALGAVLDAVDEGPHHRQRDVGLKQCQADLPGGGVDVGVGQPAFAAQARQCAGEPVGERFEHGSQPSVAAMPRASPAPPRSTPRSRLGPIPRPWCRSGGRGGRFSPPLPRAGAPAPGAPRRVRVQGRRGQRPYPGPRSRRRRPPRNPGW